jgi:2-oxoglutarate dehydrogenase E1 component
MSSYSYLSNAHSGYIEALYKSYLEDPQLVDPSWRQFFEGYDYADGKPQAATPDVDTYKEVRVRYLIHAYRSRGHLKSDTNPVRTRLDRKPRIGLADVGLTEADLEQEFDAGIAMGIGRSKLKDIIASLESIYLGSIGFEYMYMREPEVLEWFEKKCEYEALHFKLTEDEKRRILFKLNEAVVFENFLHTKYIGQKRFSLEGGETTIPALDSIINNAAELGVEEVVIGMAHRGRLNVLANIMGKTYEQIFSEFEGTQPDLTMGDGDVKYHMGFSSQIQTPSGKTIDLKLSPNPSHLEAVDPVVQGFARAKIYKQYNNDEDKVLPILIHGDAAIAGQGVVYEVAQMTNLDGYTTGGTIHFVINNQVGFTTDFGEARSSIYCTDVAKVIDAPVLHVNGDHPEAVIFCTKLAVEFRTRFNRDIFIDMVCYRRHGHNESDEPKFTQPSLYNIISKHPNPREVYNKRLIERGEVDAKLAKSMDKEFRSLLQDRLNMVKQQKLPYQYQPLEEEWRSLRKSEPKDFDRSPNTSIKASVVKQVGEALIKLPAGFKPLKQIEKQLKQRQEMFFEKKELNWACAELLAYGSLLLENKVVRLSGQDSRRGTFSHRHAVLRDAQTNESYSSLDHIAEKQEIFDIHNSLLSEFGVLGFEFGYAMANPNALVIWEAQFGDFANGAQVMIDQFITASYTKWHRMNGLTLFLPHGYEGQGPEHSNARPERFLQMSAGWNMFVCNITTPANLFHVLRRQLALPFRMPLVIMSPKSLLRHPKVVSPVSEFTKGGFKEVISDEYAAPDKVKKVLMCSGKIFYELQEEQQKKKRKDVAILRVEQLHPFPKKQVMDELSKFNVDEVYWVQEEPENMGAWAFILRSFREVRKDIISRRATASTATGYHKVHQQEQQDIIDRAFA